MAQASLSSAGYKWGRKRETRRTDTVATRQPICKGDEIWRFAYLRLGGRVLIVTVGGSTKGSTRSRVASTDTAPLGQVLLALRLANLDLLFLTTATKLIGLEGALGLELGATMLGNVPVSHGCDVVSGRRCPDEWVMVVMWEAANEGRCNR